MNKRQTITQEACPSATYSRRCAAAADHLHRWLRHDRAVYYDEGRLPFAVLLTRLSIAVLNTSGRCSGAK